MQWRGRDATLAVGETELQVHQTKEERNEMRMIATDPKLKQGIRSLLYRPHIVAGVNGLQKGEDVGYHNI